MNRLLELLKDYRVLIYIFLALFSIFYVYYAFTYSKVIVSYSPILPNGTIIYAVDGCKIKDLNNLYSCINKFVEKNQTFSIETSAGSYLIYPEQYSLLQSSKFKVEKKINKGIDIGGGIRVILKARDKITHDELVTAANVIEKRLNAYGLKSVDIRIAQDSYGNSYIIITLPTSDERLIDIIKKEGKFEAKIGNVTVFTGQDIVAVKNYPPYSWVGDCIRENRQWTCRFRFAIAISEEGAKRFAEVTKNLSVIGSLEGAYLSKDLELYIDGKKVDQLKIAADLKGRAVQEVEIRGYGVGATKEDAMKNARQNMEDLVTILSYGSLPTTFDIVSIEKVPPLIGNFVLSSIIKAALLAFILVSLLIIFVYRNIKAALLIITNMLIETVITIAIGILLGQTFDLPAIAGVIIAIGTGVDDQILTVEEILKGKKSAEVGRKVWKILFIVISSFITIVFAMFPLLFAGLGLLKGFAIMTLIGAFIGAFITRPAFVKIAEKLL